MKKLSSRYSGYQGGIAMVFVIAYLLLFKALSKDFGAANNQYLLGVITQSVHLQLKAAGVEYHTNGMDVPKSLLGDDKAVTNQPRWFKIGTTLCDINTQQKIVDDLLGECTGLSDDTLERRQVNSYKFYIGDEDGGFSGYDVPTIAFKYIHVWGDIEIVNLIFVTKSCIQKQAFKPVDLIKIEYTMRLMMVASNCQRGQMDVRDGGFIPMIRSCLSKWDIMELPLVAPNLSVAEALPATAKRSKETSPKMPMVTPISLPTPKQLLYGTTPYRDNLLLTAMDVTTPDGAIQWNRVPELVSIELMLHLYFVDGLNVFEVNDEFAHRQVPLPLTFDVGSLITMSLKNLSNATSNVKEARQHLVNGLHGCFVPRESDLLHKWYADSKRYSSWDGLETTNTQLDPQSRVHTLSLDTFFLLRHIMYSHKITVSNIFSLWASFYTLIMRR
jgi:hypothetical protein